MTPAPECTPSGQRIKVLYIASVPHSGSTVLSLILGAVPGCFAGGELFYLWHLLDADRPCMCGAPIRSCPAWTEILAAGFGDVDSALRRLQPDDRWLLARSLPLLAARSRAGRWPAELDLYTRALGDLYRAIQATTGCRVIVDSSKSPSYAYLLARNREIDLRLVHLVRDPRATAYSWRRRQNRLDAHPTSFGVLWAYWNAVISPLARRTTTRSSLLRYEDFVSDPRGAIADLVELSGEELGELPFLDRRTARLGTSHLIGGNFNLGATDTVTVREDDEWRSQVGRRTALATTSVTWPVQRRYGYPLRLPPSGF